ncbi:MAG: cytochrome b [Burkholderiales bacterium]|nr:cytochrome b [Betaproteobacteria bacterium]
MSAADRGRYGGVAVFLHWLIAILVFVLIGLGWYMVDIPRNTPERAYFFNLHKSIGLTTFVVIALRVAWRLTHVPPQLPSSLKQWEAVLAAWTHKLLYACLLVMPVSGYVASNFTKFGVKYFGIELPPWGPENKVLYGIFNATHVVTSYVFVALIVLHVAAAFKHLLIDRDDVFRRMLPGRG